MNRVNPSIVLLLVSVLINGVLIGMAARDFGSEPEIRAGRSHQALRADFNLRAFMTALPPEAQAVLRERLSRDRRMARGLAREAMAAQNHALSELVREDFDPEEAAAALSAAREARARLQARSEALLLQAIAGLDVETRRQVLRAAMSARLDRRLERGPAPPDDAPARFHR